MFTRLINIGVIGSFILGVFVINETKHMNSSDILIGDCKPITNNNSQLFMTRINSIKLLK